MNALPPQSDLSPAILDFRQRLESLPKELYDRIEDMVLHDPTSLGSECTYLQKSSIWRDVLLTDNAFPWFWDIEEAMTKSSYTPEMLDWEMLYRTEQA